MQLARIAQIAKVFADEGLGYLTGRDASLKLASGGATDSGPANKTSDRETAARLRRTLERLGPTFVKFGQLLATRIDLFSDEFTSELGKLHSSVPPFPTDAARTIIENDLGQPIAEIFADFPAKPIASASIAQVYKARLKQGDQVVAVKVQRPDLETNLLRDLEILVQISGWIDTLVPVYRRSMIHKVAQEYANRARQEINFLSEADAVARFKDLLEDDHDFYIPKVYRDLCASRVIVMDWVDGTKLDEIGSPAAMQALGVEPKVFCQNLLRLQVCMSYEHGFVHGDTHPGNLILRPDGKIGLIDFGLHAHIPKALRTSMVELLYYQSEGRYQEAVDIMAEFSPPEDPADLVAYKKDLLEVVQSSTRNLVLADNKISAQLIASMRVGAKYRNKAVSELLMIIRNLTIVEGIILRYCPSMDPEASVNEIIKGIIQRQFSAKSFKASFAPLMMQIGMTISRRPETIERLLKIERNFASSKSLGDFLRREEVVSDFVQPSKSGVVRALLPLLYILAGAGLAWFFLAAR